MLILCTLDTNVMKMALHLYSFLPKKNPIFPVLSQEKIRDSSNRGAFYKTSDQYYSKLSRPFNKGKAQHQGLFKWVSSLHQVAKVLEFQLQHQSFQRLFRAYLLQNGLIGSPQSPRDSQESSPTQQFKSINSLVLSFLYSPTHIYIWPLEKI